MKGAEIQGILGKGLGRKEIELVKKGFRKGSWFCFFVIHIYIYANVNCPSPKKVTHSPFAKHRILF